MQTLNRLCLWLEKLSSKFLGPFTLNLTSSLRISQKGFEKLVVKLSRSGWASRITYLKSSLLSETIEKRPQLLLNHLVIVGGADYDIKQFEYEQLKQIKSSRFYVQNLNFPDTDNVRVLPIGVEDLGWARNGMPWNFQNKFKTTSKKNKVLVGPFAKTSAERLVCLSEARKHSNCEILEGRLPNWSYSKLSSQFHFVACPRGNGMDTHRFWETLYRGSIPVVVESPWALNLYSLGIPMFVIPDWGKLGAVTIEKLPVHRIPSQEFLDPNWWRTRWLSELKTHV